MGENSFTLLPNFARPAAERGFRILTEYDCVDKIAPGNGC